MKTRELTDDELLSPLTDDLAEQVVLEGGSHESRKDGVCAMEMVAWMAGDSHTDAPDCVSGVLQGFVRTWNDDLEHDDRNRVLKPVLRDLINTDGQAEERHHWMLLDWLVRTAVPTWIEDVGDLKWDADQLRALPEIRDIETAYRARGVMQAAVKQAMSLFEHHLDRSKLARGLNTLSMRHAAVIAAVDGLSGAVVYDLRVDELREDAKEIISLGGEIALREAVDRRERDALSPRPVEQALAKSAEKLLVAMIEA